MSNLRSKRVLVPALAVAVTAVGAGAWTAAAQTDDVRGSERDQVVSAVADAVTDGQVTDVETSDDPGEAYDVEVRLPNGSEVDLALNQDLAVVSREDENRDDDDDRDDDRDYDRVLDAGARERAEQAALEAVGSGTMTDVEASDDPGEAYDVEVRLPDGSEVDLALDENFAVVSRVDDDRNDRDDRQETDDDRVLDAGERERAEQAALEAVGSGTTTDVEASDDRDATYEVEVVDADGVEWHVDLDAAFDVVDQRQDR
ncbi:PepSY domain-containing protein [Nesterenkonia sp. Act20]|uniref:PepSY domain-containing protein n=1 Tax=Nesterenkonia sp. Act20 TaxID=1483432 RepID=UPI001C43AAD1|nr:PepSY domain-containing protein [Nesterenkonia sp. Act20]